MKFSGRLQIEGDPRNWLKTDLNLSNGRVELMSGGDVLGSWSTAQVKAERVEGDRFELHLGDDRAVFAADDALAFSYEALPVLARKTVLSAANGLRGILRKGLTGTERPVQPLPHPVSIAAPAVNAIDHREDVESFDLGDPQMPTHRLRDLIQAAVRNNPAAPSAPEAASRWGGEAGLPRTEEPDMDDRGSTDPETHHLKRRDDIRSGDYGSDPVRLWPADPVAVKDSPPDEGGSVSDEPELGPVEIQPNRPTFDLSTVFAGGAASYETMERSHPFGGLVDHEKTGFEDGDTLGDSLAEPFGPTRGTEEAMPAVAHVDPPSPVIRSLDTLIDEVRNGAVSPSLIVAVTDLIKALADAVGNTSRR